MGTPSPQTAVSDNFLGDERWQLVQRIVVSPAFQKSGRLRDLLQYLTEQTIHGYAHELTEQHIGEALFHKPSGYSPLEDSSVRVHARQLRLKLHEYFDGVGRDEPLIVEIPKGGYVPLFRAAKPSESPAVPVATPVELPVRRLNPVVLPWALCGVLVVLCVSLFVYFQRKGQNNVVGVASPPWPF